MNGLKWSSLEREVDFCLFERIEVSLCQNQGGKFWDYKNDQDRRGPVLGMWTHQQKHWRKAFLCPNVSISLLGVLLLRELSLFQKLDLSNTWTALAGNYVFSLELLLKLAFLLLRFTDLKIKGLFKVRDCKHLLHMNNNSYSGLTNAVRSPYSFPIRRQKQRILMRKVGNDCISRQKAFRR